LDGSLSVHQCKGDAAFVGFALTQLAENQRAVRYIVAVHQECVIFAPHQNVASLVRVVGEIQIDIGRVQDTAYRTMYFRIFTEEECLQSHSCKGYRSPGVTAK